MKFLHIHYETYDEVGNRLTETEGAQQTNYTYNNINQLTQMNEGGVITTFQYDNNGNLIQKSDGTDTWEYIYDDGCSCNNRLTEIKLNSQTIGRYFYDGDGKRIKKIEDGMTTIYIYSGIKVIYEKVIETGVETKYISSLAKIENGIITYYHVDHLGSTRQMTDSSGNALFTDYLIYKPFGEIYTGNAGDEKYLFNGKEKDTTGLYYYGARYYDPKVGRFVSMDAIPSVNRYVYVLNNPLKYADPSGRQLCYGFRCVSTPPPTLPSTLPPDWGVYGHATLKMVLGILNNWAGILTTFLGVGILGYIISVALVGAGFGVGQVMQGEWTMLESQDGVTVSIDAQAETNPVFIGMNKTGEQRNVFIDVLGEGTFNFGFMNLNNSSTSISIRADRSVTINMDIEMEGGEVNIEINAPGSTVNIEVSGDGIVTIENISATGSAPITINIGGITIILQQGQKIYWSAGY